jgi:hypothetical protein
MDPERTWQLGKWQYQVWAFPHVFEPRQFPRDTDTKVSDAIQAILQKSGDDLRNAMVPDASSWECISHDVSQIDEFVLVSFLVRREL